MSIMDDRPSWLAPLDDPRNEEILGAAFDVFAERGIQGATMLEIATRAKVSKETLYARFDSKEGLFYALLAWGSRQSALDPDHWTGDTLEDPVAALRDYAAQCLIKMMQPEALIAYRIVVNEAPRAPEVARVFDEFTCGAGLVIQGRIAEALNARGLADIPDAEEFSNDFIGLLRGNVLHEAQLGLRPRPSEIELTAYAHRVVDRLLRAYAPAARTRAAA
ncbi:MAG: TetR family transcriptional regulator [Alphaproteobacteria bacterium]|nr:TetR family transcriptional regulator [Alphaproteobacteria bacterium]